MYDDLAAWWTLLSPAFEYAEEAADLVARLDLPPGARPSLLELGAGGGSLASHLKRHFRLTLSDLSPAMLAASAELNPECEHLQGDMRTLRLGRQFDVVLVHDAIMYAADERALRATLETAALHCRPGGTVALLPDWVRETFSPGTEQGGHDAPDGRGLRWLAWTWDPDPTDDTYVVDYAFLLRSADGTVSVVHDRHVEGLFPRDRWLEWLDAAGLPARTALDSSGREIFLGRRTSGAGA